MKKNKHKKNKEKVGITSNFIPKTSKILYFIVTIFVFFFVGWYGFRCGFEKVCGNSVTNKIIRHTRIIKTPNGEIRTEVADTKSSRELGLSGRQKMEDNEGLLFIFDTPGRYGFWMKDMLFSLDIIWINKDGVVVEIERNVKPESYPKAFINASPATYVLEINEGEAEKKGLFIGSKVKIVE